jgi:hypothetical protein
MEKSFTIASKGNDQLVIKTDELSAGPYQHTLIVNGNMMDGKKMSFW